MSIMEQNTDNVFNFSAGPAGLPKAVMQQAQKELINWQGLGTSVMEISHRSKEFIKVAEEAEQDLREREFERKEHQAQIELQN